MPSMKLSRKSISGLSVPAKPETWWDSDLAGFGLAVRPTGSQSWVVQYRPGSGGRAAPLRRVVIGNPEGMTPEDARARAKTILAQARLGQDVAADRAEERKAETFAELAERWFSEHVETKRKASTAAFYRNTLDIHVLPILGAKRAVTITRQDVARLHATVAAKAKGATKVGARRVPKEKTRGGRVIANRCLATVGAVYGWALGLGLLPTGTANPTKGVEAFREEGRERFLTAEEMVRLGGALSQAESEGLPWQPDATKPAERLKHAPKEENRRVVLGPHAVGAIRLLMLTGCRLREVLRLEWTQIEWSRGLLVLPDSKTGKKTVVLGSAALGVLEGLPRMGRYVIASGSAGEKNEKPRADLSKPWKALCRAAGLESVRLHDLRHSAAAVGANAGLSLHQIGGLLGHKQARTTAKYAHLIDDAQRAAADRIGNTVAGALGLVGAEVVALNERRRA